MRIFRRLSILFVLLATALTLAGCRSRIPESDTVIKSGRLHHVGSPEPYTGLVTGVDSSHGEPGRRFSKAYVNGIQEGHTYTYHPNGNIASREYYRDGKANGIASYYYESGRIKAHVHLENGLRGGEHGEAFYGEDERHFSFFRRDDSG